MISLTSSLPLFVDHLGTTRAALYERQRALVRLGLLQKPQGRGRGSGAEADPHSVALLILSVLITDSLSEMDDRVIELSRAPIHEWRKRKYCRLTGESTFLPALKAVLGDHNLAKRVTSVDVKRHDGTAKIYWKQKISKNLEISTFGHDTLAPSLRIEASLDGNALAQLAAVLAAERSV